MTSFLFFFGLAGWRISNVLTLTKCLLEDLSFNCSRIVVTGGGGDGDGDAASYFAEGP